MKTTIQKTEQGDTYTKIITEHVFLVNNKKVRVYTQTISDIEDIDSDYPMINEQDISQLTDTENETFNEQLQDFLDLKVGESKEITEEIPY